jgi:hypothetical protein
MANRECWTFIHGMIIGRLFLLAFIRDITSDSI